MAAEWRFPSNEVGEIRKTRDAIVAYLQDGGYDGDFEACRLILGELLSNAVLHGHPGTVTVQIHDDKVPPKLTVTSPGKQFVPQIELPPVEHEGGRGLFIVAHLASAPDVRCDGELCTVSVGLPVLKERELA